jgi:DNA polymerase (family 10)
MKLATAQNLATRIVEELSPYCTRIEIAGSIRRYSGLTGEVPEVNDIDLVLIPSNPSALRDRVLRYATPIQDGPLNLLVRLQNGVQLDIFMARAETRDLLDAKPTNWGSLLLCRTGSKEHNIKLCQRANHLGLQWKTYEGIYELPRPLGGEGRGEGVPRLIASATEQDIFTALELNFVPPENRI